MNYENKEINKLNIVSIIDKDNSVHKIKKRYSRRLINKICLFLIIQIFIFIYFNIFGKTLLKNIKSILHSINNITHLAKNKSENDLINNDEFNEFINEKYLFEQSHICENQFLLNNKLIEEKIKLTKINIENLLFNMFIYKNNDVVSKDITNYGSWELKETKSLLSSLSYYSKKTNISNNKIYFLDIGANIGWYSLILANNGYNVLSFEPSKINYYIFLKNYCINKDLNITIINKGLDIIKGNFKLYHPLENIGNALISQNETNLNLNNYVKETIKTEKLSYYVNYLSSKNLALIKLDVEGSEVRVIESGIDLIKKYHVPFIFMEWYVNHLKSRGTDPKLFLELLLNNGYKIAKNDFFSKRYYTFEELLTEKSMINIYIIYIKFLE